MGWLSTPPSMTQILLHTSLRKQSGPNLHLTLLTGKIMPRHLAEKNKNRQKKCTLAKIVHGQCNTNMQNHFNFIAVLHCALYVTKRRRLFSMSLVVINPLLLLIGMISFAPLSIHCMI